jgi:hypothetical protein
MLLDVPGKENHTGPRASSYRFEPTNQNRYEIWSVDWVLPG